MRELIGIPSLGNEMPISLIDTKKAGRYCISEEIDKIATQETMIFDLNFHDEDMSGWTEGDGWLDELIGLREELIQGDFRVLYLAWLKAAEEWRNRKQEDKRLKEELARKRRLEEFAVKEKEVWQQVKALIEEKKPKLHDSALVLLKELRELAEYRGKPEEFKERIAEIQQTYSNQPALRDRILQARLI